MKDKKDLPTAIVPGFYSYWTMAGIADWCNLGDGRLILLRSFVSHAIAEWLAWISCASLCTVIHLEQRTPR